MAQGNRRTGRELALKIVFGFIDSNVGLEQQLGEFWSNFRFRDDVLGDPLDDVREQVPLPVRDFAEQLARGVHDRREELDRIIAACSANWSLERMSRVDLAVLRLACFELLHMSETPASVVINEAIEIGRRYGTKETPAFINGILDRIARERQSNHG